MLWLLRTLGAGGVEQQGKQFGLLVFHCLNDSAYRVVGIGFATERLEDAFGRRERVLHVLNRAA